jgi:hypothetical protein
VKNVIKAIVKIFAKNPPSIVLAFAGLLALAGQTNEAYNFLYVGVFLQVAWILMRFFRR